jgi:hypothetical protein
MKRVLTYTGILILVVTASLVGVSTAPIAEARAGQAGAGSNNARLLAGAIDFHVHSLPDMQDRILDAVDLAKLAKDRGMRGIVLKNHFDPTASIAYMVRKQVPGIEVFGGIALNRPVGGLNVVAVEHMVRVTGGWGRVVWFPTRDSEFTVSGEVARDPKLKRPFVSVSKNGALLPEVKEIIAVIAKHQLVLETGHSSAEESLLLLAEGKKQGVQHMLVTHAANAMNLAQMQEATKLGGFLEFINSHLSRFTAPELVRQLRAIGVEWCVLATDLGQAGNAMPPDGLADFMAKLVAAGMTEREVAQMAKDNPARLLGIPAN